jgi:hypothetical protein
MQYSVNDVSLWADRIAKWASVQRELFFLNSCGLYSAAKLDDYEVIVGVGVTERILINDNLVSPGSIQKMVNQQGWKFFVIAYDFGPNASTGNSTGVLKRKVLKRKMLMRKVFTLGSSTTASVSPVND